MQQNEKQMISGETIRSGAPDTCPDCHMNLVMQVLRSNAGYYIGTQCDCGPYSRESGYFPTREAAYSALPAYLEDCSDAPEARSDEFRNTGLEVFELD